MAQEVISDADMKRLEAMGRATPGPAMPDVLTDEQMNAYSSTSDPETDRLRKVQALRYPTSAEQGGTPGAAIESPLLGHSLKDMVGEAFNTSFFTDPTAAVKNWPTQIETGMGAEAGFLGASMPSKAFVGGATPLQAMRVPEAIPAAESLMGQIAESPIAQAGRSMLVKVKTLRGLDTPPNIPPPNVQAMEQKMAPSGREARLGTERLAPELAQNPILAKAKDARFNQTLFEQHQVAGAKVNAAEQSVPRTTVIPQQQITDAMEAIIENYRDMGATEAATAVAREWEKWAAKDANIAWDDYLSMKRRLGKQMEVMGQFRESGTAAERATGQAMKEAYRAVSQGGNVSKELEAANHEYWLTHSAMEDSGLSFRTGRKINEIAEPPKPGLMKRVAREGGKHIGRAALTVGGYEAAKGILGSK